jgi:hypothetical protein
MTNSRLLVALTLCAGVAAPSPVRALGDEEFQKMIAAEAARAPEAPFARADDLPAGFKDFLSGKGESNAGALTNGKVALLYHEFKGGDGSSPAPDPAKPPLAPKSDSDSLTALKGKGADPASSGGFFDGAKKVVASPYFPHFAGVELGNGPHPGADYFEDTDGKKEPGWDLKARAAVDGLGARVTVHASSPIPTFGVSFLKYGDLVGGLGLDKARTGIYNAFFSNPETPLGGYQIALSVDPDPHLSVHSSHDDKEALDSNNNWFRNQTTGVGVGVRPLGNNSGKGWNFTVFGGPEVERHYSGSPTAPDEKTGIGATVGASFKYDLDKLPIKALRPPPVGNGVIWPDYAKTSLSAIYSQLWGPAADWSTEVSLHITKYVQITPGIRTFWTPAPTATPMLGLDIQNPK